ncbi:MAG: winged helix-turn-helix domain-containing protein [Actinomycetota bacterium]|nr:winged helix-turn-helix domain-containing protein [Actinomycetota bacterium]
MAENKDARIDQELVKALSHPIRVEILESLQGRIASPSELSKEMEESLGVISYHANTLVKCGCLELVHTEPRRGAVEHFFGITPRSFIGHQDWRRAPLAVRSGITSAALETFVEAATAALEAGTIDARDDSTLSWMPITVDEAGWEEIAKIMEGASRSIAEVHARSAQRLGEAAGIPIVVGLAAFEAGKKRGPEDEKS